MKFSVPPFRPLVLLLIFGLCACAAPRGRSDHFAADIPSATPFAKTASGGAVEERSAPLQSGDDTTTHPKYSSNRREWTEYRSLSTFSLDVDTASYAQVRKDLNAGRMPAPGSVRIEEMINYFQWSPSELHLARLGKSPFEAGYELARCPWNDANVLLSITVRAQEGKPVAMAPANLVLLVDVSGNMQSQERLPLVQSSLKLLVEQLRPQDRVSLVTFADRVKVVLAPTPGNNKAGIRAAIDSLTANGGTAGDGGLQMGYNQAAEHFMPDGENRVLLFTDGEFNMGVSSVKELKNRVKFNHSKGIALSVFGVGARNYNDTLLVGIANAGSGSYHYLDNLFEAHKTLVAEMRSTLATAARDVKAQVEFNPALVENWTQIGYEKRQLAAEAFNDDQTGAAYVGKDRQVTVLYELRLKETSAPRADPLRYGKGADAANSGTSPAHKGEIAFVKLRWKEPGGRTGEGTSDMVSLPVAAKELKQSFESAGNALRFSAAVAAFSMKLNHSLTMDWHHIAAWADAARGSDPQGYRAEFVRLVNIAAGISQQR